MVEASLLLPVDKVVNLLSLVDRVESPQHPLLAARAAVNLSLLPLADKVVASPSLPLPNLVLAASLNPPVRAVRVEAKVEAKVEVRAEAKDKVAKEVDRVAAKTKEDRRTRASPTATSSAASKAGEAKEVTARAKVAVTDKVERVRVEASSRTPTPATRSPRVVAPRATRARRAQSKRWT